MVVALHVTTFWLIAGLVTTFAARGAPWMIGWIVLTVVVHLILTLGGAYGSKWWSAIPKAFILILCIITTVAILIAGLMAIGIATI